MKVNKLCQFSAALALASQLMFICPLKSIAASPVAHYPGEGLFIIPLDYLNWDTYFILVAYDGNPSNFLRTNPDGSLWWHGQANKAWVSIYSNNSGQWPPPDGWWDPIVNIWVTRLYEGYGQMEFGFRLGPDGSHTGDGNCTIRAQLTNMDSLDGKEYTLFYHLVVKDWRFLAHEARFEPLGFSK